MTMRRFFKSTLMRYTLTLTGAFLVICLFLSILILHKAANDFNRLQVEALQTRSQTIVHDVEAQIEVLQLIAEDIAVTREFSPALWKNSEYNQRVLLKMLTNYRSRATLTDEYFLVFRGYDYVFQSTGYKTYSRVYEKLVLGAPEGTLEKIKDTTLQLTFYDTGDQIIIAIPLRVAGFRDEHGFALLGFVSSREKLFERIQRMAGDLNGLDSIAYEGFPLIGENQTDDVAFTYNDQLVSVAWTGRALEHYDVSVLVGNFSFIAMIIAGTAVIILLTWYAYRPVAHFRRKYAVDPEEDILEAVDQKLDKLMKDHADSQNRLQQFIADIRRQLLYFVLEGHYTNEIGDSLITFDPVLAGPYYAVCRVEFAAEATPVRFISILEEMSADECHLYALCDEERHCLHLLLASAEQYPLAEMQDMVDSRLRMAQVDFHLTMGQIVSGLDKVADSLCAPPVAEETTSLGEILADIRGERPDEARRALEAWLDALPPLEDDAPQAASFMLENVAALIRAAEKEGLSVEDGCAYALMLKGHPSEFAPFVRRQVEIWLAPAADRVYHGNGVREEKLIEYIRENFRDSDLCLDKLSSYFNLSVNTITRYVKQGTGRNFKEFLTELRINAACKMLAEGRYNVSEVCTAVGYTSPSHFIRIFRSIVGVTPLNFRDNPMENKNNLS